MSQAKEETGATSRRLEDVWYVLGRARRSLGLGQWEKEGSDRGPDGVESHRQLRESTDFAFS